MLNVSFRNSLLFLVFALFAGVICACDKGASDGDAPEGAETPTDYTPHITPEMMPLVVTTLVFGESTEEAAMTLFGEEAHLLENAAINEQPAIAVELRERVVEGGNLSANVPGLRRGTFMFLPDSDGVHRLASVELTGTNADGSSLCAWLVEQVGQVDGSTTCRRHGGNTGNMGEGAYQYCVGSPDGSEEIQINCRASRQGGELLEYRMW